MRFFSPPEKPVVEVAAWRTRLGMFVSSIAASIVLAEVLQLDLGSSPRASRWALTTIRRYLATVTPGIGDRVLEGHEQARRARARRGRPR